MLNYYDRPFVYFPPRPNRLILNLGKIYNRYIYLPGKKHLINPVICENTRHIRKLASEKKNRLLFCCNHPSHSDPQIIMEAYRQINIHAYFMAAYDLFFRQSKFNRWVMQKAGTFSVDREAFNSEPIKQAVNTLVEGKYHLTIFSEGRPFLQNDKLTPFHDGGAFIATAAQKALDRNGKGEKVLIIPSAIKLTHKTDCRNTILDMLFGLYSFLGEVPDRNKTIPDLIEAAALNLMDYGLKTMGYPVSRGSSIEERQRTSAEIIIRSLEEEMKIYPDSGSTPAQRVKAVRNEIHRVMLTRGSGRLWAESRIRAQKIMLAMKILSYPAGYVRENPTLDRCGETVERLIEDKQSFALPPYAERASIMSFGEIFTLEDIDPEGSMKRNELQQTITERCEVSIGKLLDRINSGNSFPGSAAF